MKNKNYLLNTLLTVVTGIALLACTLVSTFMPYVVIPRLDTVNMVLLSLAALVLDHYLAPKAKRCWVCIPVFGALCFGILPLTVGFFPAAECWKYALLGAAVFTAVTWMFTSACSRLRSGPAGKAAALMTALGIFLAAQCFAGMLP